MNSVRHINLSTINHEEITKNTPALPWVFFVRLQTRHLGLENFFSNGNFLTVAAAILLLMDKTDEFSFLLKPSKNGVGVFAAHDIKEGTLLRLMGEHHDDFVERNAEDVPKLFRQYCLGYENGKLICPKDFGQMSLEWYINHAARETATATSKDGIHHYAARDIKAGEEITIDYNLFNEEESSREDYYRS